MACRLVEYWPYYENLLYGNKVGADDMATVRQESYWRSLRTLITFCEREGFAGLDM